MKRTLLTAVALALAFPLAFPAGAQDKKEEVPFWAIGRPKNPVADKMAPVPAHPIPTAAADLPVKKIKLPPGFKAEVWASGILDARGMRQGDKGTVFVSSLFVAGKLYAVTDRGGKREVKTLAEKLFLPNGIEYHKGNLYIATPKEILRYDNIEANLDSLPAPKTIYADLPGEVPHGWKFIKVGPDGKLYVPVGAPCNICEPDPDKYALIFRINLDGSGREIVARGVRNTVGFDFHPKTGDLWFGDNQRDWLSEDLPNDELNHVTQPGKQHFGYPYCHQGSIPDPEFGWGHSCNDYAKPAALLGPHAAPLGMRFYDGKMFPAKYRNAIFLTRHGPWNRSEKYGADVLAVFIDDKGQVTKMEPFLSGLVENNQYLGRPADVMVMTDGSLQVSDDYNGAIYRITYSR